MHHRTIYIFPGLLSTAEQFNPHGVLENFFKHIEVPYARKTINLWLTAAFNEGHFNSESPASLLFFYEHICRLLEAATLYVCKNTEKHPATHPLPENLDELPEEYLYCQPAIPCNNWISLPLHLTPREFYQPFLVFAELFACHSMPCWRTILYNLFYQALSEDSYATAQVTYNPLTLQTQLCKLVEAARLIVLRGPDIPDFSRFITPLEPLPGEEPYPAAA